MICPECEKTGNGVVDSRKRSDHVWRRRKCYHCRFQWQTIEIDKAAYLVMKTSPLRKAPCQDDSSKLGTS